MKPFKTFASFCLGASALLLVTSCTKEIDDKLAKTDRDVEQLNFAGGRCGRAIGLQIKGATASFYYESPIINVQDISNNDYVTDKKFVEVTATTDGSNGITTVAPNFANTGTEGIGVKSNIDVGQNTARIDVGETLIWKLGTDFPGFAWYGFALQMQASKTCNGTVRLYRNNILVGTVPFTGVGKNAKNFNLFHTISAENYFTEMRFSVSSGNCRLNAYYNSPNPLNSPNVKLFVIDLPNLVYMSFNGATPWVNATLNGNIGTVGDRQLRNNAIPEGDANSGDFNSGTKNWLNITASSTLPGGGSLIYTGNRLGVRSSLETSPSSFSINTGEMITVTAGTDLPFKFFRTLQLREAHLTNTTNGGKMSVKFYKGATLVGSTTTTGIDAAYKTYDAPLDFDKFTISGTAINRASLGRPGIVIKLSRGCAIL